MAHGLYFHIGKKLDEDNISNACSNRIIEIYDLSMSDDKITNVIARDLLVNYDLDILMNNVNVYYVRYSKPEPHCGIQHLRRYFGPVDNFRYETISVIGHSINCDIERCVGSFKDFCKEFDVVIPKIEFAYKYPSEVDNTYKVYSTVDEIVDNYFDEYKHSSHLDLHTLHHLFSRAMKLHVFKITYNAINDKVDKQNVCCPIEAKDMGTLFDWIFKHYNHSGLVKDIIDLANKESEVRLNED